MTELQELIALKKKVLAGEYVNYGICKNLTFDIDENHLKSWANYSGCYSFPINVKNSSLTPADQYSREAHWEGRQLKERLSLLNHLIECQKAEGDDN